MRYFLSVLVLCLVTASVHAERGRHQQPVPIIEARPRHTAPQHPKPATVHVEVKHHPSVPTWAAPRHATPPYREQYQQQYYSPNYISSHRRYRPEPPKPPRQYAPQFKKGQWKTSPWGCSRPTVYTVPDDLRDARSPEHVQRLAYGTPEE